MRIRRGDIIWVDFRCGNGHIQRGRRPCVVVSSNQINGHANTFNVIPGTTNMQRKDNPVHVYVKANDIGGYMGKDTLFLTEQLTTIDKEQIIWKSGTLTDTLLMKVNAVILRQLGMNIENEGSKTDEQTSKK